MCYYLYQYLNFSKSQQSEQLWLLSSTSVNNINIEIVLKIMNIIIINVEV